MSTITNQVSQNPAPPTSVVVSTTSIQVLPANLSRTGLVLTNTSSNVISLSFGVNKAGLGADITLYPEGVFNMDAFLFTTQAVNAIASAAKSVLSIQEFS